jgi:Tfp pilus assembly protein PilE
MFTESHQSGRSMIEVLGVLAIVGILSILGLGGYNMGMHRLRENNFLSELAMIPSQIDSYIHDMKVPAVDTFSFVDLSNFKTAAQVVSPSITVIGIDRKEEDMFYDYALTLKSVPPAICHRIIEVYYMQPKICIGDETELKPLTSDRLSLLNSLCLDDANAYLRIAWGCLPTN